MNKLNFSEDSIGPKEKAQKVKHNFLKSYKLELQLALGPLFLQKFIPKPLKNTI